MARHTVGVLVARPIGILTGRSRRSAGSPADMTEDLPLFWVGLGNPLVRTAASVARSLPAGWIGKFAAEGNRMLNVV